MVTVSLRPYHKGLALECSAGGDGALPLRRSCWRRSSTAMMTNRIRLSSRLMSSKRRNEYVVSKSRLYDFYDARCKRVIFKDN